MKPNIDIGNSSNKGNSKIKSNHELQIRASTYRKRLTKYNITGDNLLVEYILGDEIYLISLLIDSSGSMSDSSSDIRRFLLDIYQQFKDLQSYYPLLTSRIDFNEQVIGTGFRPTEDLFTEYNTGGGTSLYDAIEFLSFNIFNYTKELQSLKKKVHNIMICISDGEDLNSSTTLEDAQGTMGYINPIAQTIYLYCGEEKAASQGRKLGFQQVIDLNRCDLSKVLRDVIDSIVAYIEYDKRIAISYTGGV